MQKRTKAAPAVAAAAYPINDAAVYMGISRSSIYRLINSGQLAKTEVLGRTLIRKVDADACLARCATTTDTRAA